MKDREKMCNDNYPDCKNCEYPILPVCKWMKEGCQTYKDKEEDWLFPYI